MRAVAAGGAAGLLTADAQSLADSGPVGMRRNVRAFGAKGDGRTDDTDAFNAASFAGEPWRKQLAASIHVPPGSYRIDGTVFVRRGQELIGDGDASIIDASKARGRSIVLGSGKDGDDPGGAPTGIAQLQFLGGSGSAPLISTATQGFTLRDLFISAAGTAMEITGADGIISNVIVDQALNGLVLRGARNVLVTGLISYLANYAVTIDLGTNDVALSDMIIAYSKYASILFADGATGITSVRVAGATFVSSIEYPGFIGHVHARAQDFDAQFADCVFRNWRGFAVHQGAGRGADLSFSDCVFDGSRSHPSYNASATARGVRTGADGRFRFNNCRFRHLAGEAAMIGPGLSALVMDGGAIEQSAADPIGFDAHAAGRIRIRGVDGFGRRIVGDARSGLVLPWSGTSGAWRITAARRGLPGGLATAVLAVTAAGGAGNVATCTLGDPRGHGAAPALSVGFGDAIGGPAQIPFGRGNGLICVSADAPDVEWTAETIG